MVLVLVCNSEAVIKFYFQYKEENSTSHHFCKTYTMIQKSKVHFDFILYENNRTIYLQGGSVGYSSGMRVYPITMRVAALNEGIDTGWSYYPAG